MKVTVHTGLTFNMGQHGSNQFGRVDVTFEDIDPNAPLEPQLVKGKAAAAAAFKAAAEEVSRQAQETYDAAVPKVSRTR